MPKPQPNADLDGLSTVTLGMNSGVAPRLLPLNQVAFAVNCTFRGGLPRTRPVWRKVALSYADATTQARATEALWQVGSFYQAFGGGENCLVAMVGGRLFRYLVGSSNVVQEVTPALGGVANADVNNPINPDGWMYQAEDWLVVQNGAADPWFFDGAGARRSLGAAGEELPAGRMGHYVQGRVWQSDPSGMSFRAGDLVYSHGFNDGYDGRSAVLQTQENTFLSGGGAFGVPVTAGRITSMFSVAIADTSLGQGPLQVGTLNSVFSVQVPFDREEWANTTQPLMTVGLPNYGPVSQLAAVSVNGDAWYRALDGLRSYQVGRRDLGTWVNTPLSVEVERVLALDTQGLLGRAGGVLFNNRLLETCSPYEVEGRGTAHRGVVALDFNNISSLTSRSQPAYDGLWTGVRVLQMVVGVFGGVQRCFAWALSSDNKICLYELLMDDGGYFDWDGAEPVGVESFVETRAMGYKDNGNVLKKLLCADLYVDRLGGPGVGTVTMDFKYRSDEDPQWVDWKVVEMCAPLEDCVLGCVPPVPVREQYRTYVRLADPADGFSQLTKRLKRTGYEFQQRVAWTGFMQWNRLHYWAMAVSDSVMTAGPAAEGCVILKNCDLPWFDYSIE